MLAKTRTINVYVPRRVGRETLRINETSVTVTKTEGDEFSQSGPCLVDNGQLSSSFSVSHPRALFFSELGLSPFFCHPRRNFPVAHSLLFTGQLVLKRLIEGETALNCRTKSRHAILLQNDSDQILCMRLIVCLALAFAQVVPTVLQI